MKIEEIKKVRVGKVKKDSEGEWMVPVYVDGKFNDDMTYYAGSGKEAKEDADGTRDQMIKDFKNSKEYEFTETLIKRGNRKAENKTVRGATKNENEDRKNKMREKAANENKKRN